MKKIFKAIFLISIPAFCLQAAYANENIGTPGHRMGNSNRVEAQDCRPASSTIDLDINDVRAQLMNGGDMWWDLVCCARYEVPFSPSELQRGPSSLFAGSVWVGGIDQGGQLKVAAATYRQNGNDYFPGPLDATGSTSLTTCNQWDHQYQVFASDIVKRDSIATAQGVNFASGQTISSSDVPNNMLTWPGMNNPYDNGLVGNRDMAPFFDVNGDGTYDPAAGDYPTIYGGPRAQYADQMIWWVYNDKGNVHTESGGEAIGLEVHTLAFAFKTNDEVNDMTFYRYTLFNKATTELDSAYMGQWTDPDLGCYTDDYIACDTLRSMGIVYNASAYDGGNPSACVLNYGHQPPFLAIDYFQGPLDQHGKELGMSSFLYYNNDFTAQGNPQHTANYYGYLSGSWVDGTPFTEGGDAYGGSKKTKYVFPDPPNLGKPAWSECSQNTPAGDRRMVQSSGPFKLEPGATNEVVIGVVWVRPPVGTYPCPSFALLDAADDKAQALFNSNFKILNGPDAPNLNITELDQKLIIQLVNTNTPNIEGYSEADPVLVGLGIPDSTFKFQGYQIYQLVNSTVSNTQLTDPSQARLVFQCDIKDNVTNLVNFVFDPSLNASVPISEVSGAHNAGIQHSFEIDNDLFASGNEQLVNFQSYYYLAISYAYNNYTDTITHSSQLEPYLAGRRNIRVYTGIPHKPAPENGGMAIHSNYGSGPEITRQEGGGNGGNWVQLTNETVSDILANSFTNHATYQQVAGPVLVKVVDPKNVPGGNFELLFRDSTMYTRPRHYNRVDTILNITKIVGSGKDSLSCKPDTIGGIHVRVGGHDSTFVNGTDTITIVIGSRDTLIGAKDTMICVKVKTVGRDTLIHDTTIVYHVAGHDTANSKDTILYIGKNPTANPVLDDTATWTLRRTINDSIVADRNIVVGNEQVIPDWGLSVYIQQVRNPGSNSPTATDNNGYIGSSITYASPQETWLTGIANQPGGATFHWIRAGRYKDPAKASNSDYTIDTFGYYANILGATWAPYDLAAQDLNFSPAFPDPLTQGKLNRIDSLVSVDIVFTSDKSKWTRCIVVEANPEPNLTEGGVSKGTMRQHASLNQDGTYATGGDVGFSWFPGYAIDPDRGKRLNILFAEDSRDVAANGNDMMWDPTSDVFTPTGGVVMGGRHYIYIMRSQYDGDAMYKSGLTPPLTQQGARAVYKDVAWTTMPLVASGFKLLSYADGLIPTTTTIQIRVDKAYQVLASDVDQNNFFPHYTFSTSDIATTNNSITIAKNALDTINVVPNPYYGYAGYEINQLDNRVRITNLPPKCEITIYTLSGTLVKKIERDDPTSTYFDWDLKNNLEVPIASGVYLIHVNADGLGEVTLKWFGVMRPIDLSSF